VEVTIAGDVTVLWYALTILLGILTFRESLQFGIAPRRYFFSFENILEVALIGLTAALLFHGPIQCHVAAKREVCYKGVQYFIFDQTNLTVPESDSSKILPVLFELENISLKEE
jgi:hypothetical protein